MEQTTTTTTPHAPVENTEHTSTGSWFLTIFLAGLPLIGLILLLVWAFSHSTPVSKRNWARAMLLWMVIAFVFVFLAVIGGVFGAAAMGGGY